MLQRSLFIHVASCRLCMLIVLSLWSICTVERHVPTVQAVLVVSLTVVVLTKER